MSPVWKVKFGEDCSLQQTFHGFQSFGEDLKWNICPGQTHLVVGCEHLSNPSFVFSRTNANGRFGLLYPIPDPNQWHPLYQENASVPPVVPNNTEKPLSVPDKGFLPNLN